VEQAGRGDHPGPGGTGVPSLNPGPNQGDRSSRSAFRASIHSRAWVRCSSRTNVNPWAWSYAATCGTWACRRTQGISCRAARSTAHHAISDPGRSAFAGRVSDRTRQVQRLLGPLRVGPPPRRPCRWSTVCPITPAVSSPRTQTSPSGLSHWATRSSLASRQDGNPRASIQPQRASTTRATAALSHGRASRITSTRPLWARFQPAAARL
jgi:hypothetical protein